MKKIQQPHHHHSASPQDERPPPHQALSPRHKSVQVFASTAVRHPPPAGPAPACEGPAQLLQQFASGDEAHPPAEADRYVEPISTLEQADAQERGMQSWEDGSGEGAASALASLRKLEKKRGARPADDRPGCPD